MILILRRIIYGNLEIMKCYFLVKMKILFIVICKRYYLELLIKARLFILKKMKNKMIKIIIKRLIVLLQVIIIFMKQEIQFVHNN